MLDEGSQARTRFLAESVLTPEVRRGVEDEVAHAVFDGARVLRQVDFVSTQERCQMLRLACKKGR